jgi:hypothetical protein
MRRRTKRILLIVLAVVFVGLVAGMVIPALVPGRECGPTPAMERQRNMRRLLRSLRHYAMDNEGNYPYSPEGGAKALEDTLTEYRVLEYLRWDPAKGLVQGQQEHNYLYLNPPPDSEIKPGTIILVERDFFPDDGSLCVGTRSGEAVILQDIKHPPAELLGRSIAGLDECQE